MERVQWNTLCTQGSGQRICKAIKGSGEFGLLNAGFDAIYAQPNAGSQGEYSGLLCIRNYHLSRGDAPQHLPNANISTWNKPCICNHGEMKVVAIACDNDGNISLDDLKEKAAKHSTIGCSHADLPVYTWCI